MNNKINDNEIDRFLKSHKIAKSAINKIYGDGSQTDIFDEWINDNHNYNILIEHLRDEKKYIELEEKMSSKNKINDINRLVEDIKLKQNRHKNKLKYILYLSITSAAAIIAISFVIWNYNITTVDVSNKNITSINVDNINKPTLVLNNGEILTIEEVVKRIDKDKLALKKADGNKVVYTNKFDDMITEVKYNSIIVPSQYTYTVILSDSSEVTINAGSKIRYPIPFTGDCRTVELDGEAYFKVKKSNMPFVVKSGNSSVKVYGTEFNVNSFNDNDKIEVVLCSGSVGFNYESHMEVRVKPNQMVKFDKLKEVSTLYDVDIKNYLGWMDDMFVYKNTPLIYVIADIERWYGVKINCNNIDDIEVNITLDRRTNIDVTLQFIQKIINKTIVKERKEVYTIE